jgi:hypothetical protein
MGPNQSIEINAEEAMKKFETKCSLVVPQTVPQLPFGGTDLGENSGNESARKTFSLVAVRVFSP